MHIKEILPQSGWLAARVVRDLGREESDESIRDYDQARHAMLRIPDQNSLTLIVSWLDLVERFTLELSRDRDSRDLNPKKRGCFILHQQVVSSSRSNAFVATDKGLSLNRAALRGAGCLVAVKLQLFLPSRAESLRIAHNESACEPICAVRRGQEAPG